MQVVKGPQREELERSFSAYIRHLVLMRAQPSASLTWLDHDPAAAERSLQLLSSLKEKEARDEFGIGAIRDAISDQLFPGVSTIQTRLRYFLFARVPGRRNVGSHT